MKMYKNERWKCLFREKTFDRVIWHAFKQKIIMSEIACKITMERALVDENNVFRIKQKYWYVSWLSHIPCLFRNQLDMHKYKGTDLGRALTL